MKIRIGDKWGKKLDGLTYLHYYLPFRIREGIKLANPRGCSEIIMHRMYEHYPDFLPTKGGLMVDIGSQYSDWSIIAAKKYGSNVISFEASSRNYEIGLKNIRLNKLESMIALVNCAIGNEIGKFETNYDGSMVNATGNGQKETIDMITLDSFVFGSQIPDLIKIDIEGYELEALKGMEGTLFAYTPRIIIETHSSRLYEECGDFLYGIGYELKHGNPGRKGTGEFDWVQETFWSVHV